MDRSARLRRNRLIFFAVLIGVPALALVAYVATMVWTFSFGS
jgi:hypothetical protein